MSANSKIEWTDHTWNPVRGCTRVSEGCRNCYAERTAARFIRHIDEIPGPRIGQTHDAFHGFAERTTSGPHWTGRVDLVKDKLLEPLKRRSWSGKRVFVNSMSDLFHEALPDAAIDRVFATMAMRPDVTFQALTKRAARLQQWAVGAQDRIARQIPHHPAFETPVVPWPLPNVWLGVSVEDQKTAKERIWPLLKTPAAVRFISAEPLLGPLDLDAIEALCKSWRRGATIGTYLDWVIAGGESGHGARPAHPDWFRKLRDQCAAAGVPFFFKQWGEWASTSTDLSGRGVEHRVFPDGQVLTYREFALGPWSDDDAEEMARVGKAKAGRLLDGREHNEFPAALCGPAHEPAEASR